MKPCYIFFHRWGKWESYEQPVERRVPTTVHDYGGAGYFRYYDGEPTFRECIQKRQTRRCERCGLTQDREVE